ncbi:hybrid sensor histidine kinase/response regulator [Paracidobacterium acidisoli]|uniref:histidine kinase n=1 Tax=Paracidobacterium acidisoli TaxID=2303751 RepID=A0A372IT94_9BACT|nr:hybrid sensor histidine kinase/response regulator [Paracidobacterium acidisoli]MBT9329571.1 response regulator [Paracidobacterium acidisoli]
MIHHRKRPVLYVDDTIEQRYAMRRILETEGFAVLEAGSGKEALALMQQPLALAVVDVKLPDMSGYDLSRRIKAKEPHLPILQVSASFSDPDLRASGFSGGADAYIAQPVHPAELIALVRRILRTSETEDLLRFLATIGSKITFSTSLEDTAKSICSAVTPYFADRCAIHLNSTPEHSSSGWTVELDAEYREAMKDDPEAKPVHMISSRLLISPLSVTNPGFGAIAFELNKDREYSAADLVLAADLASRAGLSLQNCILLSSEQSIRSALIQAEKLATAGRMSAAIAHEINNPLEAVTNLLFIIEQSQEATPLIRETAGSALTEVTRLAHIARQSLGFYRELRTPSTLDLSQSVLDALEFYNKRLSARGIEVTLNLGESVLIQGIRGEIRQVISNLLVNALESMENGGEIAIATFRRNDRAMLSISDNGPGIGREIQSRVFEPFFTTKQGTGTGLGLWITKSIVEKHDGKILLTSRNDRNHGSKFEIDFPAVEQR